MAKFFGNRLFNVATGWDRTEHEGGGHSQTRIYEKRTCRVDVEIDVEKLMNMLGHKAMTSKSKQSKALHGIIKVKVSDVRPL